MQQKTLTAQICGAYFGCNVTLINDFTFGKVVAVDEQSVYLNVGKFSLDKRLFSEIKLQLRRLESLTYDEALHIHRSMFPESMGLDVEGVKLNIENLLQKSTWGFVPSNTRKVIDYLRSIKIDIGYGDIPSLIDAGLAIEKK